MKLKNFSALKNIQGKRILVRCDFDVPLKNGKIIDDSRLRACLPTIKFLLKKSAKVILIGHLGRPQGKFSPELSLVPVQKHLEKLLKQKITFIPIERYVGEAAKKKVRQLKTGQLAMLENLRFSDREELNCRRFAKSLAGLADVYINEAFAVSHRAASSVSAIREYLPVYSGLHLDEEIEKLSITLKKPTHPLTLIIGGAKIETKLPVIKQFIDKAEHILIGGAVANDFFKGLGYEVGTSLINEEYIKDANVILEKIALSQTKLILPLDVKVANGKKAITREPHAVLSEEMILDIGPKTAKLYQDIIRQSKMIIWNGPMGKFEDPRFASGTRLITEGVLKSNAKSLIGGGETGEIFKNKKLPQHIFISVGGGAMLDFLAGKKLPGLN